MDSMTPTSDRLAAALSDRYRLERELGQGGMATVYLAQDLKHERRVALKILRPELAAVIGAERFLHEIKTTANLQHPHILPLHDSGTVDGTVFYVMPYVEGESLGDRLRREKQLPVNEAVRLIRDVAAALDYAHRHGVIHRDIKPENILLHDGQALIADFGIALAVSRSDGGTRLTETGLSLGTPHYMSPEQAMGERTLDARTDVYAMGCVLYELLTGQPPFTGPTAQAIVARVLSSEPEPVTALRRTVPPHVAAAVHTALQKLPADRFASAAAFGAALGNAGYANTATVAGYPGMARPGWRANRPAQVMAAFALAGLLLAAWQWSRPAPAEPVSRYSIRLAAGQEIAEEAGSRRIALSPDGRLLAYVGRAGEGGGTRIYLRPLDQLTATAVPGSEGGFNPSFSPDGRRLAFVSGLPRALRVVSVAGGPATVLTDSLVDPGGVGWGSDGYIYYDGKLTGDGLARVRESGGSPEPVTMPRSGEAWHFQPSPLPNGRGVLFTVAGGADLARRHVAVVDLATGQHVVLAQGGAPRYTATGHLLYTTVDGVLMAAPFDQRRMTLTGEAFPVAEGLAVRGVGRVDVAVSDAGTLAYISGLRRGDESELYWVDRAGTETPVDPGFIGGFGPPSLSPDGRRVALAMSTTEGTNIWIKELDRGPASRLTFQGGRSVTPSWMADGRSVVFASDAATPRLQLFVGPADGSAPPTLLSPDYVAATGPHVTRDGAWLVFQSNADLFAAPLKGDSAVLTLLATPATEVQGTVSPDGRWLAYASDESGTMQVYVRPFPDVARSKRQVSVQGGRFPRWSRDGRELFYVAGENPPMLMAAAIAPGPAFSVTGQTSLFSMEPYAAGMHDPHPDGRRFLVVRPRVVASRSDQLIVVEGFHAVLASHRP